MDAKPLLNSNLSKHTQSTHKHMFSWTHTHTSRHNLDHPKIPKTSTEPWSLTTSDNLQSLICVHNSKSPSTHQISAICKAEEEDDDEDCEEDEDEEAIPETSSLSREPSTGSVEMEIFTRGAAQVCYSKTLAIGMGNVLATHLSLEHLAWATIKPNINCPPLNRRFSSSPWKRPLTQTTNIPK